MEDSSMIKQKDNLKELSFVNDSLFGLQIEMNKRGRTAMSYRFCTDNKAFQVSIFFDGVLNNLINISTKADLDAFKAKYC